MIGTVPGPPARRRLSNLLAVVDIDERGYTLFVIEVRRADVFAEWLDDLQEDS